VNSILEYLFNKEQVCMFEEGEHNRGISFENKTMMMGGLNASLAYLIFPFYLKVKSQIFL
jgi:hypothetical protein